MKTKTALKWFAATLLLLTACGPRKAGNTYIIELDPQYNVDSGTLLGKYPIQYETPAGSPQEKGIQNRMLNGFNCWNEGFDAWKSWGEVLYSPESIYHVNGVRMTLEEYQQSMNITLARTDIQMGAFENMVISDNWTAIRYATTHKDRQTGDAHDVPVTEFVRFKDFGERGMKVDEGWGGIKGDSYEGLMQFQTPEEQAAQRAHMQDILDTVLPDTPDLEKKYPILYPTRVEGEMARKMKQALLRDIDNWNRGYDVWAPWTDTFYTPDARYDFNGTGYDRDALKRFGQELFREKDIKKVRIYNILISGDWAAVHAWNVVSYLSTGRKDVFNTMSFYHFVQDGDTVRVDRCWIKDHS